VHLLTVAAAFRGTDSEPETAWQGDWEYDPTTQNDGTLPRETSSLQQVAVIGPNAGTARTLGGGRATVFPSYVISPLKGLRAALGDEVEIVHAIGVRSSDRTELVSNELLQLPDGSGPGVEVIFFDATRELGRQERQAASMMWWGTVQDGLTPTILIMSS
jgi:beta-glucosidase